jgi:hypothetical protein
MGWPDGYSADDSSLGATQHCQICRAKRGSKRLTTLALVTGERCLTRIAELEKLIVIRQSFKREYQVNCHDDPKHLRSHQIIEALDI